LDPSDYRRIIGGFATGVSVITALDAAGNPVGMTANSLTSVSLDPILLAVCFQRGSSTLDAVTATGGFVVNLLDESQQEMSGLFARYTEEDRFAGLDTENTEGGIPVLPDGLGHLECVVHEVLEGGDHIIVLGRVEAGVERDGRPLLFYKGKYGRME